MLTLKQIQDGRDEVIERLKIKNFDATAIVDQIIELDNQRKLTQTESEALQAEMNKISKSVGQLIQKGDINAANEARERTAGLKEQIKDLSSTLVSVERELLDLLVQLPNLPHQSVPSGKSAEDNLKVKEGGKMPELKDALPHWELAKKYKLIDFELGVKLTGAGFPVYKGKGAKLQRALINFFLEEACAAGYEEVLPPLMVNEDSAYGTDRQSVV